MQTPSNFRPRRIDRGSHGRRCGRRRGRGANAGADAGRGGTAAPGSCTDACELSDTQACPDTRDSVTAIEADSEGNLYVCGESGDVPGTATVLASENSLLKLDADGPELWSVRWGSSSWDGCSDLALGPDGLIATVGRAHGKYDGSTIADGPALSLVRIQ